MDAKFEELKGKTLTAITKNETEDELFFHCDNGDVYKAYHMQECCESVSISDIEGDFQDLIGAPITMAEEITNSEDTFGRIQYPESFTWTFYRLATIKGYVTIRWLGESNGYYSESVDFVKL